MSKNPSAFVKVTGIGQNNTFTELTEMSTDLPSEAMGEAVTKVVEQLWKAGEDPIHTVIVITFDSIDRFTEKRSD